MDNARSAAESNERVIARLESELRRGERLRPGPVETGTVAAGGILQRLETELRRGFDVVELIGAPATGGIGVHSGSGAWVISTSASEATTRWLDPAVLYALPLSCICKPFSTGEGS